MNKENIPKDAHLIFTVNHQNALMDAMALASTLEHQPVFMARSDIFKKPIMARLLTIIKILPIYRIRDGYTNLKKNDAVFQKTIDVIKNHNGLVILPEGNHEGLHRLRTLKKGFARIAFQTEEASNFQLNMKIIPVGIDYTNYQNHQSYLFINFGKPISVSDFYKAYKENSVTAIDQLKSSLSDHLKPLMIHIESVEYYSLYDKLRDIYREKMCTKMCFPHSNYPYRFLADKEFIRLLTIFEGKHPDQMSAFQDMVIQHNKIAEELNLEPNQLNHPIKSGGYFVFSSFVFLLTFPVFIYGWLNNILPYRIPLMLLKKIKDVQFHSSIKYVLSMVSFPFFHIIQTLILRIFTPNWNLTLLYFISVPVSGIIAFFYYKYFMRWNQNLKYFKALKRKSPAFEELQQLHHGIIKKSDELSRDTRC